MSFCHETHEKHEKKIVSTLACLTVLVDFVNFVAESFRHALAIHPSLRHHPHL